MYTMYVQYGIMVYIWDDAMMILILFHLNFACYTSSDQIVIGFIVMLLYFLKMKMRKYRKFLMWVLYCIY